MLTLMIFLPLIGFLINGLLGRFLPKNVSGWLGTAAVLGSFVLAVMNFNLLTAEAGQLQAFTRNYLPSYMLEVYTLISLFNLIACRL